MLAAIVNRARATVKTGLEGHPNLLVTFEQWQTVSVLDVLLARLLWVLCDNAVFISLLA